jgi:S-(hydroxymethyl)glutathione dehydrogenase / alcohol dehydrogenase
VKAAVCRGFGEPLVIEQVEIAPPAAGEVTVDVRACAICHSDVLAASGAWGGALPVVYGHEASGVVSAVGPDVVGVVVGDRVVVTLIRSCGDCFFCGRGDAVLCESPFRLDDEPVLRAADGSPIAQGLRTGAFAEQVVVHASQVAAIPEAVAFDVASLLGCGVMTGVGAVTNVAGVEPGMSVVVVGTGGVGLNAVQGAALAGADPLIAVDIADAKLAAARRFGATHTINPASVDAVEAIRGLTAGRRADRVVIATAATSAIEQGLAMMRRGGSAVIVGMPAAGATASFDPAYLAHDGQRILGCKMGSARVPVDIPALVDRYRAGSLKLDELISGRYPLERINDAVAGVLAGDVLRNVIVF